MCRFHLQPSAHVGVGGKYAEIKAHLWSQVLNLDTSWSQPKTVQSWHQRSHQILILAVPF